MIYLTNLKVLINNALLTNKRFIIIPHYKCYYPILLLLKTNGYIKNFIYTNIYNLRQYYIIIEFFYIKNNIKKFKIILFNNNLKFSTKSFKDILKLTKFSGLFIFSTVLGILTLEQIKFFKVGGILVFYIY